jgi:hypothetical protein
LLTDQDWLDAVKDVKQLDSDADFSKAFNGLRNAAMREVETDVQGALHGYIQANNGALPTDFSQLQQYLGTPLDDSILQGSTRTAFPARRQARMHCIRPSRLSWPRTAGRL